MRRGGQGKVGEEALWGSMRLCLTDSMGESWLHRLILLGREHTEEEYLEGGGWCVRNDDRGQRWAVRMSESVGFAGEVGSGCKASRL